MTVQFLEKAYVSIMSRDLTRAGAIHTKVQAVQMCFAFPLLCLADHTVAHAKFVV